MGKQVVSATAGGGGISWEDWQGKLVVVEPLEVEKDISTIHGASDAVRANVYFVTSKDGSTSEDFEDTLIFPKVLQSQTRRQIGSIVVGRLGQGEAKKGQNAPWVLEEASDRDLKAASAFWTRKSMGGAGGADEDEDEDDDDAF